MTTPPSAIAMPPAEVLAEMIRKAVQARAHAYAAYSNHPVGAAVLDENGVISVGVNIENAAYPLGNCAEPVAMANMFLAGGTKIHHLVVAGPGDHLCTPCGGCRQRIREFAEPSVTGVTVVDVNGKILKSYDFFRDLLPDSFGPENVDEVNQNVG